MMMIIPGQHFWMTLKQNSCQLHFKRVKYTAHCYYSFLTFDDMEPKLVSILLLHVYIILQ